MPAAYDMSQEQLAVLLADEPRYRTDQVWRGLWEKGLRPDEMTDLPKELAGTARGATCTRPQEVTRSVSLGPADDQMALGARRRAPH